MDESKFARMFKKGIAILHLEDGGNANDSGQQSLKSD